MKVNGRRVETIDIIFGSIVPIILLIIGIVGNQIIGALAFVISLLTFYITTFRPILLKPMISESVDWDLSRSQTDGQDISSWFLRVRIQNHGKLPAKNCVGRLIAVQDKDRNHIQKFDPLYLYWARQNEKTPMQPVDIQGFGDFYFLDVAQIMKKEGQVVIKLRTDTNGISLPQGNEYSPGSDPVLVSNSYYFYIAIYHLTGHIEPFYVKVEPSSWQTEDRKKLPFTATITNKFDQVKQPL